LQQQQQQHNKLHRHLPNRNVHRNDDLVRVNVISIIDMKHEVHMMTDKNLDEVVVREVPIVNHRRQAAMVIVMVAMAVWTMMTMQVRVIEVQEAVQHSNKPLVYAGTFE